MHRFSIFGVELIVKSSKIADVQKIVRVAFRRTKNSKNLTLENSRNRKSFLGRNSFEEEPNHKMCPKLGAHFCEFMGADFSRAEWSLSR